MKKVLLFTHNLSGGGAEKAVVNIASYFVTHPEEEISCSICVVYDHEETRRRAEALGIPVIVMEHRSCPEDNRLKKGVNVLKQIAEMRRIKRAGQYDTCVSFLPGADLINTHSSCGEKQIVSMRNEESAFTPNLLKKIYTGVSLRRCDRIVAVTELVRLDAIRFFRVPEDKILTIHNAIGDPKRRQDSDPPEQAGLQSVKDLSDPAYASFHDRYRVILHAARLFSAKRQDVLLKAFAEAGSGRPDLGLAILGDGPERTALEQLAEKLGISERVYFAGFRSNPQDYMRTAEFFVLSSDVEGMPNVVLEAMQCGLPVVATDCGALEILDPKRLSEKITSVEGVTEGEYGLLTPKGEVSGLARAIGRMADEENLRDHYAGRNGECLKEYTWERIAAQWKREF